MIQPDIPFSALVSFHYFGDPQSEEGIANMARAGVVLIGDSGAFSAMTMGVRIDLEQYAGWITRNRGNLAWAASLDVIGDPVESWNNWRRLAALGVDTVPTVHWGARPEELDRYAEVGASFVGLGGLARRRDPVPTLRWLVSIFRYARENHPAMRFHGWGIGSARYLDRLPFFSTDSSGFAAAFRYGSSSLFDSRTGRMRLIRLDGSSAGSVGRWIREEYGVTAREMAFSDKSNRLMHVLLTTVSAQRMEAYYRNLHRVTPPPEQADRGLGTHIHYAWTNLTDLRRIVAVLNKTEKEPA